MCDAILVLANSGALLWGALAALLAFLHVPRAFWAPLAAASSGRWQGGKQAAEADVEGDGEGMRKAEAAVAAPPAGRCRPEDSARGRGGGLVLQAAAVLGLAQRKLEDQEDEGEEKEGGGGACLSSGPDV